MSIALALADAATNCSRDGSVATLTLKGSGVQLVGKLARLTAGTDTCRIETSSGGWTTVLVEEIAAVGVERRTPW